MDNLIWWTGYFTICAFSIALCGVVVFLAYCLASMIIETFNQYGRTVRMTRSWLRWKRWQSMDVKRRKQTVGKVKACTHVRYSGQPQAGSRPTGPKPPAGD